MSNVKLAKFHYFNEAGLCEKKRANDKIISEMVDAGKCKSGAILAYGSLSYFWTDNMRDLAMKHKRIEQSKLWVAVSGLEGEIAMQEKFIAEHN